MSHNLERNTNEEDQSAVTQNLQIQALMGEMKRMMRAELELIHEHLDQVKNTHSGQQQPFPKHVGEEELQLEERLMTIIGMSMMKGRTQSVAIGEMDKVGELEIEMIY